MGFASRGTTSIQLDQIVEGHATLVRKCDSLPVWALSGLCRLVWDIGGRGLSPNRTVPRIAHLLKIKTDLRRK